MWKEIPSPEDSRTPRYSVKVIINLNVLDHFCLFSLFLHLTLKFLHSIKSGLQGEFSKQPGEECSDVPIVCIYSTALYHWSVTEELSAKKTLKSWAMFFFSWNEKKIIFSFKIIFENVLSWKKIFWESSRKVERGWEKRVMEAWASD